DAGMADGEVLNLDRRDPLTSRFDHILGAVGDLHETALVEGGDVTGVEPAVVVEHHTALALEIGAGDGRAAYEQVAKGTPVARLLVAVVVGDLHLDGVDRAALLDLD